MKTQIYYFPSNIESLIEMLREKGAVLLDLSNDWEIARWQWNDEVCIVYKNKHDKLSFSGTLAYNQYVAALSKEWHYGMNRA